MPSLHIQSINLNLNTQENIECAGKTESLFCKTLDAQNWPISKESPLLSRRTINNREERKLTS
jgi:hypothetical protein